MLNENNLYLNLLKSVLTASVYDESAWRVRESSALLKLLFKVFYKKPLMLVQPRKFSIEQREQGKDWPLFGYTMTGHKRLDKLQDCLKDIIKNNVEGDLAETGVWRGGSSIFMKAVLNLYGIKNKKIWLADSFEGMPKPKNNSDGWDLSKEALLSVSVDQVRANFEKFNLLDENVIFLKGWFCDTLPTAPIQKLSLLRLDGDMYSSTMDSLVNLYHKVSKVSKGGYVIVDDYYSWPACKKAVDEFLDKNNIQVEIHQIDGDGAYWKVV